MEHTLGMGAEATITRKDNLVYKIRSPKSYRLSQIDTALRKSRTKRETKALLKAKDLGVPVPELYVSSDMYTLVMDFLDGVRLRDDARSESKEVLAYFQEVGQHLSTLHQAGLIHGDLTTSNIFIAEKLYFIDFGLSFFSDKVEDMAVDIHVFEEALESTHYEYAQAYFAAFLVGYQSHPNYHNIIKRLEIVRLRGRNKK